LEEDLFEVMDQPQVEIIDISEKPIEAITEKGICAHGQTIEFDAIILATGFGDEASGLKSLNIRGRNGIALHDAWSEGVQSHLGIAVSQFPNMFFLYGPQCPTLLVNSPAVITVQVEWLCRILSDCKQAGVSQLEANREFHHVWQQKMGELWVKTLYYTHPRKSRKESKFSKKGQSW
jgi:cation diffusion facilitator CzcD-associated flavoprotein CzcO